MEVTWVCIAILWQPEEVFTTMGWRTYLCSKYIECTWTKDVEVHCVWELWRTTDTVEFLSNISPAFFYYPHSISTISPSGKLPIEDYFLVCVAFVYVLFSSASLYPMNWKYHSVFVPLQTNLTWYDGFRYIHI